MVDRYLDLPLLQNGGNLGGPVTGDAQAEYLPDHLCGLLVHDPVVFILRVLQVAVRRIGAERLSGIALRLKHSLDFPAGILGVELVENIDEGRHVVFRAVDTVHAVVDGDEADIVGREKHLRIHTDLKVVPSEAAHILYDDDADFVLVDHADEPLPIRSVEIGPTVTIIHEIHRIREILVISVLFENGLLERDLSRVFSTSNYSFV